MNKAMTRWLLISLCLLVSACTTTEVKPQQIVKARSVLILPVESLHEDLVAASEPIYQALQTAVAKKRFTVINANSERYQQAVDEALSVSGAMYDPGVGKFLPLDRRIYIKALIDEFAADEDFSVLILPELLIRVAGVNGDHASWDGVERRIELTEKADKPYRPLRTVRGVSIKLSVFTKQGADIIQSYAGLSLPYTVNYNQTPPVLVLKQPFFSASEQKEAIEKALETVFSQVHYHAKH